MATDDSNLTAIDTGATYRATDEFPAGEECELTCDHVHDSEDEFGTTDHYDDRRNSRLDQHSSTNPDVTDDLVDVLVNESEVRRADGESYDHRYLFQAERGGVEWTLVVADDVPELEFGEEPEDDGVDRWVLITIYSNFHGSVGVTNRYLQNRSGGDDR